MKWTQRHPKFDLRALGFLPLLLSEDDPRTVAKQLDDTYAHGGGWRPIKGWRLGEGDVLDYDGDEPLTPLAEAWLRNERIVFYRHALLAVFQPDGSFEVTRVD